MITVLILSLILLTDAGRKAGRDSFIVYKCQLSGNVSSATKRDEKGFKL